MASYLCRATGRRPWLHLSILYMHYPSQATPTGFIRRSGYSDASGSVNAPPLISDPRCADERTTAYHPSQTSSVPDIPDPPAGRYNSASDWLKKKNFGTSGRQRSGSHLSQHRRSSTTTPYPDPKTQKEQPPFESVDAWFKQYFEAPSRETTPRQVRDNTLRHLESPGQPGTFHIYFQGQPGISIQALLSKWRFDRSDTPLGQLINFRLVNPPVRFKLPGGAFARHSFNSVKISDSMTIYEFCMRIAGKMGTSLEQWDTEDLTMISLELAQESVTCFLGAARSPLVDKHEC